MIVDKILQQSRVMLVLWGLLVAATIVSMIAGRWSLAFVAFSTLILALAPVFVASRLHLQLPLPFLIATTLFTFATIFMGEAFDFYERVWWWDIALHGGSAVGFGLIGFLFVFMLFEGDRYAAPPSAIAFMAFCVAITVGATWEIFEFLMDLSFGLNMQKSGLQDTMGDLIVDMIGALIGAMSGFLYLKDSRKGVTTILLHQFIAMNKSLYRKSKDRLKK
ncbi:hypothetical protein [Loktanella sp. S4079]|uniref:hypothetical protein n=1 Tax=Loktanella sp. S4079 TaxID=579483 RepID=UPI0005FA8517|nr:hypothetical protein [Loktanella sp. S4079]KJZ17970.1 hypothetical protein TW80_15845 [Loktanella sp. S4079]